MAIGMLKIFNVLMVISAICIAIASLYGTLATFRYSREMATAWFLIGYMFIPIVLYARVLSSHIIKNQKSYLNSREALFKYLSIFLVLLCSYFVFAFINGLMAEEIILGKLNGEAQKLAFAIILYPISIIILASFCFRSEKT